MPKSDPPIFNRAGGVPRQPKLSALAWVWNGMAALGTRLLALEKRAAVPGPKGDAGEPGRPGDAGRDGRDGKDGQSVTAADLAPLIAAEVTRAVAALPPPKAGDAGRDGRDGKDGQSVTASDLAPLIAAEVTRAVAALPPPKDGETGRDGRDGRDGRHIATAQQRDGHLIVIMSDGTEIDTGRVVGADGTNGRDGQDGRDVDMAAVQEAINAAVAKIPAPKNGRDGKDGMDGKDGLNGRDAPDVPVEIGEPYSADLTARDLRNLFFRDLIVNGQTYQILSRN